MDRAQENLHFVMDICDSMLYILETDDNIEVRHIANLFYVFYLFLFVKKSENLFKFESRNPIGF